MALDREVVAQANLAVLSRNAYPGRGIVVGLDETSEYLIQLYWIMGHGETSRNRVFKADRAMGRVYTELADTSKGEGDLSLIIYNAMRQSGAYWIVSNGDQTDTVADSSERFCLNQTLRSRVYEPDAPNFTPRITAVSSLDVGVPPIQMSILRKSACGEECERLLYEYAPWPGFGYCITTYAGDGSPLPSFCGDPLIMPLRGPIAEVARGYWDALNEENRVSLAVKFIHRRTCGSSIDIINKYQQIG